MFAKIYKDLVKPHIENANVVWNPIKIRILSDNIIKVKYTLNLFEEILKTATTKCSVEIY